MRASTNRAGTAIPALLAERAHDSIFFSRILIIAPDIKIFWPVHFFGFLNGVKSTYYLILNEHFNLPITAFVQMPLITLLTKTHFELFRFVPAA